MSIDRDFNIEQVSVLTKTREYIQSLMFRQKPQEELPSNNQTSRTSTSSQSPEISDHKNTDLAKNLIQIDNECIQANKSDVLNNVSNNKTKKISKNHDPEQVVDKGVFTLVTTSGVLNKKNTNKGYTKQLNLVKSVVAVETYPTLSTNSQPQSPDYSHNGVQRRVPMSPTEFAQKNSSISGSSGRNSPSKIHSPITRKRNSYCSPNEYSDSSLETESYLKPTQNIISSLQQRLSIDSDSDDHDKKYNLPLNNEAKVLLKRNPLHVRNNSFDGKNVKMPNKLEHFHTKNLFIDQTKSCNQYSQNRIHQIQNSPNNSPIRRSSSFSLKNQLDNQKCLNTTRDIYRKTSNPLTNSPIQRSSSTANIKPKAENLRRSSLHSDERNNYLDTESSSEEDFDKNVIKNKKDLTNTRYNRAFSLRRARLEPEPPIPKCPNTPEMRRKFVPEKHERPVSVDRKGGKEIQSRYMNITKTTKSASPKPEPPKTVTKCPPKPPLNKTAFSRTDSGRFSLRSPKPSSASAGRPPLRRDQQGITFYRIIEYKYR